MVIKNVGRLVAVTVLTGGLLFAGTDTSAATFKDISNNHSAKDEINFLVEKNIVKGDLEGNFNPQQTITKAQAAIILARALKLQTDNNPDPNFLDVPKTHSAYQEIAAAVAAGIFPKDEKFNPHEQMTRGATAEAIANAFKLESTGKSNFKDVSKGSKGYEAIVSLADNDIAIGFEDGTFNPNKKVTRVAFSTLVARALSSDFLPTQYNIPFNVNPAVTLFNNVLNNPSNAQELFVDNKFDISSLNKNVKKLELIEVKEIARLNGETEFTVTVKANLTSEYKGFLNEGENQLYVLIKRNGYMSYKIISISKKPHLDGDDSIQFARDQALPLFKESQMNYWYVVRGGDGSRNEETFTNNEKEYRYMAETLSTMEKLTAYLGEVYTAEQIEKLIKELGIITHEGALAQPNADGGSILNWDKAIIKEISRTLTEKHFEIVIPLGDTTDKEILQGTLQFVKGEGWRVQSF